VRVRTGRSAIRTIAGDLSASSFPYYSLRRPTPTGNRRPIALSWSGGAVRCVGSFPGALSISTGAVPGLARGLGHMAPTYFVGSRDRHSTAIAAPRSPLPLRTAPNMQAAASKALLRADCLARRHAVTAAAAATFAQRIALIGSAVARENSAAIVAAYWPIKDEASPLSLLDCAAAYGIATALPVVTGRHTALIFRLWRPGEPLVAAAFGLQEPDAAAPEVRPDFIFMPLLAFDRRGHRLGYGAGHYDRTLTQLRARGRAITVGIAYSVQELPEIPTEDHDQKLDYVLTDREWINCQTGSLDAPSLHW
jgi:5-formyltetrahydrofolate cyclo-ligase